MFYGSKQTNADGAATEEDSATSPVDFPEVKDKVISDIMKFIYLLSVAKALNDQRESVFGD